MSEMYITVSIPEDYVRGSDEAITLDMPVSYARGLGRILQEEPRRDLSAEIQILLGALNGPSKSS